MGAVGVVDAAWVAVVLVWAAALVLARQMRTGPPAELIRVHRNLTGLVLVGVVPAWLVMLTVGIMRQGPLAGTLTMVAAVAVALVASWAMSWVLTR